MLEPERRTGIWLGTIAAKVKSTTSRAWAWRWRVSCVVLLLVALSKAASQRAQARGAVPAAVPKTIEESPLALFDSVTESCINHAVSGSLGAASPASAP